MFMQILVSVDNTFSISTRNSYYPNKVFKYIVVMAVLIDCDRLKLPGLLEEEKSWAGVAGTAEELGFTA